MSDFLFIAVAFGFLLGACFGSFANVLIYRMPASLSILGRSRCAQCKTQIAWYHNVPLIGYFILRGRCANCKEKYSIRYPLVEFIMATLFAVVIYQYDVTWTTLEYLIFVFGLVTASFIDYDHMILPDEFTLGGLVLAFIGAILNPEREFIEALIGLLFGGGILWLVAYVYYIFTGREGLGGGDIKLLAWMGCLMGWKAIPFIILSSSILGSIVGLIVSNRSQDGLKAMIPFGPFLAIGALLYLLGLKSIGIWYVQLFFPDI